MANTICLITGANRGIGRGLVEIFLARPNVTVIAAVRDPNSASSSSLLTLPKGLGSKVILVKIDSKSSIDPEAAIQVLQNEHQVNHVDVVIANAGICDDFSTVHSVQIQTVKEHVDVNAYGTLYLYQAVYPLLKKSQKPVIVGVGSPLGSIGGMEQSPYPGAAYGPSKAMLHWILRKIHFENDEFVAFVADPGFVQTDMGNSGARKHGMEKAFQTVEESANGIVNLIDSATRESVGGQFRVWDGSHIPW
ncbi:SDR family oxidoreductase [Aspergillus undulatus]|uniref:SDR family oxidoreductase n=1 Tax=Aspergillus undulatus TaxID=1810928 RepID=UPI003CCCB82D